MDDDDSFELKKINEVDEFDDSGDEEEIFALEPIKNATSK